jgi:hypothetical protein
MNDRYKAEAARSVGRPKKDPALVKKQIGLKLPQWLIDKLDAMSESRATLIEDALCKVHKMKPPKAQK